MGNGAVTVFSQEILRDERENPSDKALRMVDVREKGYKRRRERDPGRDARGRTNEIRKGVMGCGSHLQGPRQCRTIAGSRGQKT